MLVLVVTIFQRGSDRQKNWEWQAGGGGLDFACMVERGVVGGKRGCSRICGLSARMGSYQTVKAGGGSGSRLLKTKLGLGVLSR